MHERKAPELNITDINLKIHKISDYFGKWLVIYFYPKDNTPGCTSQACGFRDIYSELAELDVSLIGISKDSLKSHENFINKHDLNFALLSDPDLVVAKSYGAYGKKSMYGKLFSGIQRNTYLINPEGYIVKEFKEVKAKDNPFEVLEFVRSELSKS